MYIDPLGGKFYATVEDGYYWTGGGDYARTEVCYGSGYTLNTGTIYCLEWQGYFPTGFFQFSIKLTSSVQLFQIHGNTDTR